MSTPNPHALTNLSYKIAVLCYLYDGDDRVLLLHRNKAPNAGFYSPIGGKLETACGEGPHDCAVREIAEEAGIEVNSDQLHLTGIVSETAYEGETHWLIFLFEVTRPIEPTEIADYEIDEGQLQWVPDNQVASLRIPETDQTVMWPLVQDHRGGFFMVHIDCTENDLRWTIQETVIGRKK